jgi:hypothetical protein
LFSSTASTREIHRSQTAQSVRDAAPSRRVSHVKPQRVPAVPICEAHANNQTID